MPSVLMIKGDKRPETIFDDEQFARLLDERLGYDAAQYFRDAISERTIDNELFMSDPMKYCPFQGECDKVFETQRHYTDILHDVQDELGSWPLKKLTKNQVMERRDRLWERINNEL